MPNSLTLITVNRTAYSSKLITCLHTIVNLLYRLTKQGYDPKAHLLLGYVAINKASTPSLLKLIIKQSKTNPFCKGVDLYLGRTETAICPVQAMLQYLSIKEPRPGYWL